MFSKNKFLFPQISAPFVGTTNGTEIMLQQHHDFLSTHLLAANAFVFEASTLTNQESIGGINNVDHPFAMDNKSSRKLQRVKKDRHSKIFTAQGPRDRRVRLSISTAGKFFDLQEILGFDKPSKTLDWLLTKSKAAIKELMLIKQKPSTADLEISGEAFENGKIDSKEKSLMTGYSLSKELRVKARARARERTREKMCFKKINEAIKKVSDLSHSIPIQSRNWNEFEVCKRFLSFNDLNKMDINTGIRERLIPHHPLTRDQELMQESTVMRRKLKHPSMNHDFHQNLIISKDLSSNGSNPVVPNADEDWDDLISFTPQSNQCAILNQQKFVNRCSNI